MGLIAKSQPVRARKTKTWTTDRLCEAEGGWRNSGLFRLAVKELCSREIPSGPEIAGFHPSSLEALAQLLRAGRLPGSSYQIGDHPAGVLFFYPTQHSAARFFRSQGLGHDQSLALVRICAELNAQKHCLVNRLKLDIANPEHLELGWLLLNGQDLNQTQCQPYQELFLRCRVSPEALTNAIIEAKQRKGLVLSLRSSVLEEFPTAPGDPAEGELRLTVPGGLPLQCITRITAQGPVEAALLSQL